MIVSELIKQLSELSQDKEVKFYGFVDGKDKYVTVDEVGEGRFVEIISIENDGRSV